MEENGSLWGISIVLIVSYSSTAPPKGVSDLGRKEANLRGLRKLELNMLTFPLLDR